MLKINWLFEIYTNCLINGGDNACGEKKGTSMNTFINKY